jgi:peroxiredoxin
VDRSAGRIPEYIVPRLFFLSIALIIAGRAHAEDKPVAKPQESPGRAAQLKAMQAEYKAVLEEVIKEIRAGKIKATKAGAYDELAELRKRFAKRSRELIDADPKDAVALDAILFSMRELVADADDPTLYDLLLSHHLWSPKLGQIVNRQQAGESFLRELAAKSPHTDVRGPASLAMAQMLVRNDQPREAEALCEKITRDAGQTQLKKGAERLLFEIRFLSVGKTIPDVESIDWDNKPIKMSDYRGKAVMLVFWATWCEPCMAQVPHEREFVKRFAGRPFELVGNNGDGDTSYGPKGEAIDNRARVNERIRKEQITWRSFRDFSIKDKEQISQHWNVHEWPTIFLLDHRGVINHRFRGAPEDEKLDSAIKKLVTEAEAARSKPDKK